MTPKKKKLTLEELLRKGDPINCNDIRVKTGLTKKQAKLKLNNLQKNGMPIGNFNNDNFITYFYLQTVPIHGKYSFNLKDSKYKIGAISDTHIGDKQHKLDALEKCYDKYFEEGVEKVFHAGDLLAGIGVYPGQHVDLQYHTLDDQINFCVDNYPYYLFYWFTYNKNYSKILIFFFYIKPLIHHLVQNQ